MKSSTGEKKVRDPNIQKAILYVFPANAKTSPAKQALSCLFSV
jgi:hypothetical protein